MRSETRPIAKALGFALALNLLLANAAAPGPVLHLRWNDCPAGATATSRMTFSCSDDTSRFRLIGSIVPDGPIAHLLGIGASVDFLACGAGALPDWWQVA